MGDIKTRFTLEGEQQYRNAMTQAANAVKVLNAQEKLAKAQFEQTGNAEKYAAQQADILRQKITQQKTAVAAAEKALKQLSDNGVSKNSKQFQQWETKLLTAQTALAKMETQLGQVTTSMDATTSAAEKTGDAVGSIGKKMSLQQVISGIDKITGTMEKAAGMAVKLGQAIWNNITDSASWADNVATQATILGMSVEDYQKLQSVFDTIADVTVQDWTNARRKIRQAINDPSQDQIDVLAALGIKTRDTVDTGFGQAEGLAKDWETVFWEAAEKLQKMVESNPANADLADTLGEALFGKKYSQLLPLIKLGKEAFTEALGKENVVSEEAVEKLAALNDAYVHLQDDFRDLKAEVMASLAPALEGAANVLDTLLNSLLAYLKTDDGKKALEDLEKAVSGLFEDLGKIDPESVVEGFTGVFNTVITNLQWLTDNWDGCVNALKWIVGGWAGLKLMGGALQIYNLINGIAGLSGAAAGAGAAGAAAGSAWGASFLAKALIALGPLAAFITTVATPAPTGDSLGNNDLLDENGNPTAENMWNWRQKWKGRKFSLHSGSEPEPANAVYTLSDEQRRAMDYANEMKKQWIQSEQFDTAVEEFGKASADTTGEAVGELLENLAREYKEEMEDGTDDRVVDGLTEFLSKGTRTALQETLESMNNGYAIDPFETLMLVEEINEELGKMMEQKPAKVTLEPDADAAEQISQDIGVVPIAAELIPFGGRWINPSFTGGAGGGGGGRFGDIEFHANGLPYVPFDGYRAVLHKGERVVTAREVNNSRNFSSNLYVENMNMNGASAEGLAATMAAAQRRMMRGYGS